MFKQHKPHIYYSNIDNRAHFTAIYKYDRKNAYLPPLLIQITLNLSLTLSLHRFLFKNNNNNIQSNSEQDVTYNPES